MASELFYPHYEFFEWVERGGSYGTMLALWFALGAKETQQYKKITGIFMTRRIHTHG
jgi:hypothetical protein